MSYIVQIRNNATGDNNQFRRLGWLNIKRYGAGLNDQETRELRTLQQEFRRMRDLPDGTEVKIDEEKETL